MKLFIAFCVLLILSAACLGYVFEKARAKTLVCILLVHDAQGNFNLQTGSAEIYGDTMICKLK